MAFEIREMITPGNEGAFTVGERRPVATLEDLPDVHLGLLEREARVTATLATTNADGSAQLTPVWLSHDGERILLNSARNRLKDKNLRARPRASLMLLDPANPYHFMTIDGVVEEIIDEDDPDRGRETTEHIDDLALKYMGVSPYPLRDGDGY